MADNIKDSRKIITIDCRELLPPEPLVKVMTSVENLKDDEAILMLHRHNPCSLFPKLEERDLKSEMKEFEDGSVEILIWKENL
jgi:uncharacterized protein (DUF2249 family)